MARIMKKALKEGPSGIASQRLVSVLLLSFLITTPLSALASPQSDWSKTAIFRGSGGVSLEAPSSFQAHTPPPEPALLLLRGGEELPTVNVISLPGRFGTQRAEHDLVAFGREVAESYRQVGFTDAELVDVLQVGAELRHAVVRYSLGEKTLMASVSVQAAADRHYIVTFIDRVEEFAPQDARRIAESLQTPERRSSSQFAGTIDHTLDERRGWRASVFILLGLIAAVVYVLRRRRRTAN